MLAIRSVMGAALAAVLLAVALATGPGGCTSDLPNQVGSGLVDGQLDSVLVELRISSVTDFGHVTIEDPDLPLHRQKALYLGSQGGTGSRMLLNYDFSDVFSEDYPETLFTEQHIKAVKLSLTKLSHYSGLRRVISDDGDTTWVASGQPLDLYYGIRQLTAEFDSTMYATHPGPAPAFATGYLNTDFIEPKQETEPFLRLVESDFLQWLDGRGKVGLSVELISGSDEGLVGFAAREMLFYGELNNVFEGTVVAPNLVVEFQDNTIAHFLLPPVADTSTFETVTPVPADPAAGIVLRTGLRAYPAFDFDFSGLPADVLINRAVLKLTNDQTSAFGNSESIVVSEVDSLRLAAAPVALTPAELDEATYLITGQTSLDPTATRHLNFDVTTLVQRLVNGVYVNPRGLVLTAGEDIFSTYDLATVDPDFYFTEFHFFGTAAADSLRPRLEITYSRHDDRVGGAR